jgi:hypothetical protein
MVMMMHGVRNAANLFLISSLLWGSKIAHAQTECESDTDCEAIYRFGSTCLESGECSNPFVSGCLDTMNPTKVHRIRHCNSDDKEGANCRVSAFNYPEIRVHNQDWEVAIIFSWILQICLMEILDVPVTVGLGSDTAASSFYSIDSTIPYSSKSYAWDAIHKANELGGNCQLTDEDCIHVIPDVWLGQRLRWEQEYQDGQLDYLDGNGQVGKVSWYVPKFTASRYPFTVTHMSLASDRQRTASVFKRPTTWVDYCHEVSKSNCSQFDGIADRYPEADETGKYFASGYIGHFRYTAKNNCTGAENNNTCTGHIVNAPCSWSTFLESQAYWNNIALESDGLDLVNGGYSYSEMLQIWDAANATRSDVIMWWYDPDSLIEAYRDTDFEFTRVYLPSPSVKCRESRVSPEGRCSADPLVRRGNIEGSCDNIGHTTKKAIASSLRDMTLLSAEQERSPGYHYIRNFNIDELEISGVLNEFVNKGRSGQAAREAVCGWVANNTDYLKSFVPPGHPRKFGYRDNDEIVTKVAQLVGLIAVVYILISYVVTCRGRNARVFVYAQVQFIFVILFGLLLVSIGSIISSLEPDGIVCVSRVWLVSLGYTCELAPLIIKVSAMNRLMRASRRMRRVRIKPYSLYTKVIALTALMAIYLIVWTVVDPPHAKEVQTLSDDQTTITSRKSCSSDSEYWQMAYNFWEGLLIVWAFVLAFQSRQAKAEFNESRSLGMMIYSHFVLAILRVVALFVFEDEPHTTSVAISFLLSLDVILALSIYLLPKMIQSKRSENQQQGSQIHLSGTANAIEEQATSTENKSQLQRMRNLLFGDTNTSDSDKYSDTEGQEGSPESEGGHFKKDDATQFNAGESGISGHLSNSSRLPSNSSVFFWSSSSGRSSLPDNNGSIMNSPTATRRVKFKMDKDNKNLQDQLLKKEEEIHELKDVVRLLQEAQVLQELRLREVPEVIPDVELVTPSQSSSSAQPSVQEDDARTHNDIELESL